MTHRDLKSLAAADLVERYAATGIQEDKAEFDDDAVKRNRFRRQMFTIADELKSRPGDQRRALLTLYHHPNIQVRLMAAKATLAIAPVEARKIIEAIAASKRFRYAGDAGMCIEMLDRGLFVPD